MKNILLTQLALLDIDNDDHWTADGMVRLDALKAITGAAITREEIKAVAPKFSRKNTSLEVEVEEVVQRPVWEAVPEADADAGKDDGDGHIPSIGENGELDMSSSIGLDVDYGAVVRKRFTDATQALQAARDEYAEASRLNDALIMHEASVPAEHPMAAVKAFQKSQTDQRAVNAARNLALKQILSPKEYQAIMKA